MLGSRGASQGAQNSRVAATGKHFESAAQVTYFERADLRGVSCRKNPSRTIGVVREFADIVDEFLEQSDHMNGVTSGTVASADKSCIHLAG